MTGASANDDGNAQGGTQGHDGMRIVCTATDLAASLALQATLAALVPAAHVDAADPSAVRDVPRADCLVVGAGDEWEAGVTLVAELRARGFAGAVVLIASMPRADDEERLQQLGVDRVLATSALPAALLDALAGALSLEELARRSPAAAELLSSLRRTRRILATGVVAGSLQHRLNNPLAALLAEAQLLQLETLPAEHSAAVTRIVELCRRVIDVSRSIEGIGGGADIRWNGEDAS